MTRRGKKSGSSPKHLSSLAFYLDESVPIYVFDTLRAQGYNVQTVPAHLRQATDVAQLISATKSGRIFIVVDKDFHSYTFPARRILESPGVALISTSQPSERHFHQLSHQLLKFLESRNIAGQLCMVSDAGVRIKLVME